MHIIAVAMAIVYEGVFMKRIILVLVALLVCMSLVGCSSSSNDSSTSGGSEGYYTDTDNYTDSGTTDIPSGGVDDIVNRKIIYTVDMRLESDDIDAVSTAIKQAMADDEWCDNTYIKDDYIYMSVRVATSRLEQFVDDISGDNVTVVSYSQSSEDITNDYYDIESRINTLTIEQTQLLALLDNDDNSLSDTLTIVERLSEIQGSLDVLNGTLSGYDSLVDYSTVNVYIYSTGQAPVEVTLGSKLGSTFVSAWNAVGDVFEGILVAIVAVVPFLVIIVPVGVGVFFVVRHIKRKRAKTKLVEGEPQDTLEQTSDNDK